MNATTKRSLTPEQIAHLAKVPAYCRASMEGYLRAGALVSIAPQDEVREVPPIAITVVGTEDEAFWIDCCATRREATALARSLGLRVQRGGRARAPRKSA